MNRKQIVLSFLLIGGMMSCQNDDSDLTVISEGAYTHEIVKNMQGFGEEKQTLLNQMNLSEDEFIELSTDSAWALLPDKQKALVNVRNGVSKPDAQTLLQKIIPLEDLSTYMNNIYGGTIGGFVAEAADVKSLHTMYDVYWGLRLDYDGTKFKENGAGYAVIRFYSDAAPLMKIPYSPELGGTQEHAWPNGGGGFTTSKLGYGGYPEWVMNGYSAPKEGAELYEITPLGREILRSVFKEGKWQTFESDYYLRPGTRTTDMDVLVRNGIYDNKFIVTYGDYCGYTFVIRGLVNGEYHLTSTNLISVPGIKVIEKGVYGVNVPQEEVCNIREEVQSLQL